MEFETTPAAPRRLIRRLIPWTVSMGLFAGGGYGVYNYAVPQPDEQATTATAEAPVNPFASGSSAAADAQLKQLFPSTPSTPSAYSDRYASVPASTAESEPAPPQLPPAQESDRDEVATPRSAASLTPQQNPFATTPVSQFGSPTPAADTPTPAEPKSPANAGAAASSPFERTSADLPAQAAAVTPTPAEATPTPGEPAEIARGQEPAGENPLRSSGARPIPQTDGDASSASDEAPARYFGSTAAQAFATAEPSSTNAGGGLATAESTLVGPAPTAPTTAAQPNPFMSASPLPAARQQSPTFAAEVQQPPQAMAMAPRDGGITPTPGIGAVVGAGRPGERILEGVQSPALSVQKLAPGEIQVGKKCTIAIRVQNTSQQSAHNVQIRDETPFGTQLIGTAPKATVAGASVTWEIGTLSPGDERIVEMELLPTEEGELGSVATVTFSAQASAKVRCTRPQLALRLTAGPRVMIGDQHVVEIEIANPGTGDATSVMLLETIPAGVSHEAGPALEFEIGTLKPGETRRLDLVLTAEQAGRISNMMTARADANLEVEAGCDFEVIAPDLKVTVDGPKQRYLERPATYTVSVDNPGTASAKEVQLITQLPKGLQFVSANNMGEYDAATHSVHWSLAELPANERGSVELVALPVEPGEHTLQVASRAEQGLEDRTEAKVHVDGLVALSFEVAAVDGAIEVGGETAYDITVVNQGSKPAANVQVVAAVPQGLRATSGEGATRHVIQGDKLVFAPLAQLAPKAEAKFRVNVQGLRAGDLRTKIMVTADEVQEPITKEQSTKVYADQ